SVSGQLRVEDLPALHAAGVRHLIGNRPEQEAPDQPSFAELREAAEQLGMELHALPVVHDNINSAQVRAFDTLIQALDGPVHAFCRSGLRSATLWSLSQVKHGAAAEVVAEKATSLGFDFKSFPTRFAGVIEELKDTFDAVPV